MNNITLATIKKAFDKYLGDITEKDKFYEWKEFKKDLLEEYRLSSEFRKIHSTRLKD